MPRFQSQLGSIGATLRERALARLIAVSIPAWFDWRQFEVHGLHEALRRFNPSLVRLAPDELPYPPHHLGEFQSQLGSIGAPPGASLLRPLGLGFNPSLVRLAHATPPPNGQRIDGFQSQLGSIGASLQLLGQLGQDMFQSQLGSIGAPLPHPPAPEAALFQSQLGSIGAIAPTASLVPSY